ncbi:MAG: heme exporter protein CcmB [Bacteroidia bacterium]
MVEFVTSFYVFLPLARFLYMLREIIALLRKEILLEWKQRYALNGLLLYVISMVTVVSLAFLTKTQNLLTPQVWNVMFWIMMLFVSINAVAKSFMAENEGLSYYLYGLAHPTAIILAKIIYNTFLLCLMGVIALFFSALLGKMQLGNVPFFLATIGAGSFAFASNLTLVSAIATKSENSTTLLAVLSFPLVVPILLILINLSLLAIQGKALEQHLSNLGTVLGFGGILMYLSTLLFPFIWRD